MANLQELIPAFFIGPNGQPLTPEQIAQRQEVAKSLLQQATDTSPNAGGWASVLAKGLQGGIAGYQQGRADDALALNAKTDQANIEAGLGSIFGSGIAPAGGIGGAFPSAVAQGASPTSGVATGTIPSNFNIGANDEAIRKGIIETAQAIGADPVDLATAISYETGGTFNPTKAGPTTQWGQHRGLIQFGEPQAKQYGVDWNDPIGSQLGANGAIAKYFRSSGFKPGMSGLDLYSTINAGAPGRYSASDANNGGAPGNVADKWNNQMRDHRAKALALLGVDSKDVTGAMLSGQQAIQAIAPIEQGDENPMAGMPVMPQGTEYVDPLVAPFTGKGNRVADFTQFPEVSTAPSIPFDQGNFDERFGGPAPVAPQAAPMAPQPTQTPVNEELLAQHDAMWGGALSPTGRSAVAQALTGYFPDAPSANRAPITAQNNAMSQAPMQQPTGGVNPQIIASLLGPNSSPQARQVGALLIGQYQQQQEAMQAAQEQQRMMTQRLAIAQKLGINPALAGDEEAWKAAIDQATRNRNTVTVGNTVLDANTGQPIYEGAPARFTTITGQQAQQLGLDPNKAYNVGPDGKITPIAESGVTVNVGGGEKFGEKLAELDAKAIGDIDVAGRQAARNINRINQLEELLNASPSGIDAAWRQRAGEWGINTDGLKTLQAAQAVINSLVPEQRQPGSGPMSDADLELFKQSLPRTINQPGGNALIIATMKDIAKYDAEGSRIVQRLRANQLTRAQAFDELNNRVNPIDNFKKALAANNKDTTTTNGIKIRKIR